MCLWQGEAKIKSTWLFSGGRVMTCRSHLRKWFGIWRKGTEEVRLWVFLFFQFKKGSPTKVFHSWVTWLVNGKLALKHQAFWAEWLLWSPREQKLLFSLPQGLTLASFSGFTLCFCLPLLYINSSMSSEKIYFYLRVWDLLLPLPDCSSPRYFSVGHALWTFKKLLQCHLSETFPEYAF